MNIKDRINKLGGYFKEMQITSLNDTHVIYVVVRFPNGWIVDESVEEKFNVTVGNGGSKNEYYFCSEIENGEDHIFDAVDYCITKMKDAIERAQLLSQKTTELKDMFEDETIPLSKLKTLSFTFSDDDAIKKIIVGKKKKAEESVTEDKEETDE